MPGKKRSEEGQTLLVGSIKIAATYGVVACLWILLSDELLHALTNSVELYSRISLYKGWFFVAATAFMLFHLVHRFASSLDHERAELQESLRKLSDEKNRQSLILNSIPSAVFIKDTQHRYLFANEESCRLLGRSLDDVLGKSDADLLASDKAASAAEEDGRVLGEGVDVYREGASDFPVATPDLTFITRKIPLYDAEGRITGLCGFVTDITEHVAQSRAMAEGESRLELALAATRSAVWEIDSESRTVVRSGMFPEFFGVPAGRGFVQEFWSVVHEDDLKIVSGGIEEALKTGQTLDDQFRIYKDGEVRWLRRRAKLTDRPGRPPVLVGTVTDVTDTVQLQRQAEASAARTHVLVHSAPDGIVILDEHGRVVEANESFAKILGATSKQVSKMSVFDWDTSLTEREYQQKHEAGGPCCRLARWRRTDGTEIDVEIDAVFTVVDDQPLVMAHCRDVTERLRDQEKIRRLALFDDLTGLPNRNAFLRTVEELIGRGATFEVAMIDIDRFRDLNENYGHVIGDKIVCEVARRITTIVGKADTLARLGGDDFALVVDDPTARPTWLEDMLALFETPVEVDGVQVFVSVSVGACSCPCDTGDMLGLMRCLDISLHESKLLGTGHAARYVEEMGERERSRLEKEVALRQAVADEQFVLYYQPIIDLASEQVIGCEALVRWEHPELGMISPDEFIGLAEETNQIIPLGRWILRAACHQAQEWRSQLGRQLKMSVNVSSKQFSSPSLVDDVASALADSGLDPQMLQIEITESLLMDDPAVAADVLRRLKALGVALAIDDFGTGYSSLGYLHRYPVDCLKVDRSFVADAVHDDSSATICRSIVSLAHSLRLTVVAEGVETTDQAAFLLGLGCEMTQGYLYSRPVDANRFVSYVSQFQTDRAA